MEFYRKAITRNDSNSIARVIKDLLKNYDDLRKYLVVYNTKSGTIRVRLNSTKSMPLEGDITLVNLSKVSDYDSILGRKIILYEKTPLTDIDDLVYGMLKHLSWGAKLHEVMVRKPPMKLLEMKKLNIIKLVKKRGVKKVFDIKVPVDGLSSGYEVISVLPINLKASAFRQRNTIIVTREDYNTVPLDISRQLNGKTAFESILETMDIAYRYELGNGNTLQEQEEDVQKFNSGLISMGINDVGIPTLRMFLS